VHAHSTRTAAAVAWLACLALCAGGCWRMQDLGAGNEPADTDTVTQTEDDSDTETDPWPADLQMCDIDILFVFDTSQSMMLTVEALSQSGFGGFTNMLASYPQPGTIRVALTNQLYGTQQLANNGDPQAVDCSEFATHGMDEPVDVDECQDVPDKDCAFASGQVWIEGPSTALPAEFNCIGHLPCQEDVSFGERTLQAGLEALGDSHNAGFIRDGALLFLIFISDEDDQSPLSGAAIRQGLIDLKDGEASAVYVASMSGGPSSNCYSEFFGETDPTPQIIAFTELFGVNGRHYNMCETSTSAALASMVELLTQACQEEL
jgi:hypothetical protein